MNIGGRRLPARRSRRRGRGRAKRYTLDYLLSHQPKSLRKHADYSQLITYLRNGPALKRVQISRRCYSLLHHARIDPDNLEDFYRTYRLPRHPFFPLFFRIKRDYFAERARVAEARRHYIREHMRGLPDPVLAFVRYLGYLENSYNAAGAHPLWQTHLFPSTKKRVHSLERFTAMEWIALFRGHLALLEQRYRSVRAEECEKLLACFVLECVPEQCPPVWPPPRVVKKHYRRLSLRYHPDRGGDPAMFVELKRALDTLVR